MPVTAEIERAFGSGATILTASVRAARWLRREYAIVQRRKGLRAWRSPAIEDWDTWVRRLWRELALARADAPLLLTSLQERSVWARMQREDARLLVSPASIAAMAESAYALLGDYLAQDERVHSWAKADAESFRQWALRFDRECARRNWIPRAGLEIRVAEGMKQLSLPQEILLVGFERTTPIQEAFIAELTGNGVRVGVAAAIDGAKAEFVRAAGLRDEVAACAWWGREQVEKNPDARIGVLIPHMEARGELERIFRRVLMPRADDVADRQAMPFEFSLGMPLAFVPAIRAALLLLRWLHEPLREEEVSWLTLSGFLGPGGAEYLDLARQDARHRDSELPSFEIELGSFVKRDGVSRTAVGKGLASSLQAAAANRLMSEERLPGGWTDVVQIILQRAGWPGAAEARDTVHFQAVQRWERALDEVALLDFEGQRARYHDFLKTLEKHALEVIFSPESTGAPVQIMGPLEASGQEFDAVWFLSADDESWPQRGRMHPLLPSDVQKRYGMPYADAGNDLLLAQAVTERIANSAPVVVFSYARRSKDGELRPSSLLRKDEEWRDAPQKPLEDATWSTVEIEDASGVIPWPEMESAGGADVLKAQAACPFQAFAKKRLRATALNRTEWGLSPGERGKLLHRVLEKIWSPAGGALHSLEELQAAMRGGRLKGVLAAAVKEVFAKFDGIDDAWMRAYLESEQHRLLTQLREWMDEEARRVPFTVLSCEEKLSDVSVGGLKLNLRADRIDEVGEQVRLLIDYKSGEVSTRDWSTPRPKEPQLPLYAVFGNVSGVRGVLFARIRAGEIGYSGRVADVRAQLFADKGSNSAFVTDPYTDAMKNDWEDALLELAAEFLRGEAAVDPKDRKKSCQYCELPGLCRVAESHSSLDGADAEGNGNDE